MQNYCVFIDSLTVRLSTKKQQQKASKNFGNKKKENMSKREVSTPRKTAVEERRNKFQVKKEEKEQKIIDQIDRMNYAELQEELRKKGLPQFGDRNQKANRLKV